MNTPTTETDRGTLRRRMTPWSENPRRTYIGRIPPHGAGNPPHVPLSVMLTRLALEGGFRQLMLIGGWDAAHTPEREWWVDEPAANGWQVRRYVPDPRSAQYVHTATGRKCDVRLSAAWYDAASDPETVRQAHYLLQGLIQRTFDKGAILFGTPSRTGQDLLLRTLPQYKGAFGRETPYEYQPAPAEIRDIITHNFGQGRVEFVAPDDAPPMSDLYVLDARWMYAAHLRNLPVGPWTHDDAPDFEPYRPGFYRVTFRALSGWSHIGLLPVWDAAHERRTFPLEGEGWATEPEIRLALKSGWSVWVQERILAAPTSQPGSDPAREWSDRLVMLRMNIEAGKITVPDGTAPLLKAALRHILIDTVGAWKRSDRRELHVTLPGQESEIPGDAEDVTPIYADAKRRTLVRIEWYSRGKLDAMQAPMVRPEWAAMVWGRARAALNAEALNFPPNVLVALRSDAVAVCNMPLLGVNDDGKPGRFRLKVHWHFETPIETPRTETEWRAVTGGQE